MKLATTESNVVSAISPTGEIVNFACGTYERTKLPKSGDIFAEINRFLASLPVNRQQLIWETYREMHNELTNVRASSNMDDLPDRLRSLTTELYRLIDIDDLERWAFGFIKIDYPSAVMATVTNELNPEKTYVKSDYDYLVVLTLAVRFMMPIWGEYNRTILTLVGKHKEHQSLYLLADTKVIEHTAVRRLVVFIESMITSNTKTSAMILQGQGTEQLPEWILAGVLVKRLAVADINHEGGLVRNIFIFVLHLVNDLDNMFGGLRPKHGDGDSDDGNEFSQLERYRGKPSRTTGDAINSEVYITLLSKSKTMFVVEDPIRLAKALDPSIDERLVAVCFTNAVNRPISPVAIWQLTLAQWIFYPLISPTAIAGLTLVQLSNIVLVATQAILIHWGYTHMGLLVKAAAMRLDSNQMRPAFGTTRVTAKTMDILNELYPYTLKGQSNGRQSNPAYVSINSLNEEMLKSEWILAIPAELQSLCDEQGIPPVGPIPGSNPEMLAQLVIKLNEIF